MKTLKKCIKAAKVVGRNWRKELQAILRNYRTTPHATTGVSPATLLLKRPVRNKLSQPNHIDSVAEIVRERDSSQKLKMKADADAVIDLFDVGDVFKKEKRKIVFLFKCKEGTETETLKIYLIRNGQMSTQTH